MKCHMHLLTAGELVLHWQHYFYYINLDFSKNKSILLNKKICEHMISFGINIMTNTNNLGKGHNM